MVQTGSVADPAFPAVSPGLARFATTGPLNRPSGVAARPARSGPRNQKTFRHSTRTDPLNGSTEEDRPERPACRSQAPPPPHHKDDGRGGCCNTPLGNGCGAQANVSAAEDQRRPGPGRRCRSVAPVAVSGGPPCPGMSVGRAGGQAATRRAANPSRQGFPWPRVRDLADIPICSGLAGGRCHSGGGGRLARFGRQRDAPLSRRAARHRFGPGTRSADDGPGGVRAREAVRPLLTLQTGSGQGVTDPDGAEPGRVAGSLLRAPFLCPPALDAGIRPRPAAAIWFSMPSVRSTRWIVTR